MNGYNGTAIGGLADTYANIASYSQENARAFLEAETLMINILPQGACTLNWAMPKCEHHHSCFNCNSSDSDNGGICKHLIVDPDDNEQLKEINEIVINTEATIKAMPDESPQKEHLICIHSNASNLLKKIGGK